MLLPVTPQWMRGPGYWGSPFARPRRIQLRHHPCGYPIPKGVWIVKCGPNRVEIIWRDNDRFVDEPIRAPGTGLIRRGHPPSFPPPPPWPSPRRGDNRHHRETLISEFTTGTVFADGYSVVLNGAGEATAIRVYG